MTQLEVGALFHFFSRLEKLYLVGIHKMSIGGKAVESSAASRTLNMHFLGESRWSRLSWRIYGFKKPSHGLVFFLVRCGLRRASLNPVCAARVPLSKTADELRGAKKKKKKEYPKSTATCGVTPHRHGGGGG